MSLISISTIAPLTSSAPSSSNHGDCHYQTAWSQHLNLISVLANRPDSPPPLKPHYFAINEQVADTRATRPASCWPVCCGMQESNLLEGARGLASTTFDMPWSSTACLPGTAKASTLNRVS